jgi:CelD/BcsL family acetyltransferase involved in cellulose biosynthesis
MQLVQFHSLEEILAAAPAWNRLWQRSELASPLFRAEMAVQWLEQFGGRSPLRVLAVQRDGEFLALLPLVERKARRLIRVGDVTINSWSPNGDLLLDPQPDVSQALDLLVDGLTRLPWSLLWLAMVPLEAPRWQAFRAALVRHGLPQETQVRYSIGQIDLSGGWEHCTAGWSKNHRRNLRKDQRRLEELGPVTLTLHRQFTPAEVDRLVTAAFELEYRSWKGSQGDAVCRHAGMLEYFLRQARQLAQWNALRVAFLEQAGKPIAFEYGWVGKDTYYSFKVGYDPEFARFGPGHLMRLALVRQLCADATVKRLDFYGPLNEALACWATDRYQLGELMVALRPAGRLLWLPALKTLRRVRRRLRTRH